MAADAPIPDQPVGPEEDAGAHRFDPAANDDGPTEKVVAACACGWRGSSFVVAEQGYAEAEEEWERHAAASRHETKVRHESP